LWIAREKLDGLLDQRKEKKTQANANQAKANREEKNNQPRKQTR
jgi:hypothetical protein